jgi:hypothetical protein
MGSGGLLVVSPLVDCQFPTHLGWVLVRFHRRGLENPGSKKGEWDAVKWSDCVGASVKVPMGVLVQ